LEGGEFGSVIRLVKSKVEVALAKAKLIFFLIVTLAALIIIIEAYLKFISWTGL